MGAELVVRKITSQDARAFRELRLFGLKEAPYAFGMAHEEFVSSTEDSVRKTLELLSPGFAVGAFNSTGDLSGIAVVDIQKGVKRKHVGLVWGVYVHPTARGSGVGERMLTALIDFAREVETLQVLNLSVYVKNQPAISLYERVGFRSWGIESMALRVGKEFLDEMHMSLSLDRAHQIQIEAPRSR